MTPDPKNEFEDDDLTGDEAGATSTDEAGDAYPRGKPDADPGRTCVGTGQAMAQSRLLRLACSPDGGLVPDVAGKLPGRGVWVTPTREALAAAIKRRGFARGLKANVTVPDGLAEQIETLLLKRCLDTIGLARKSGMAVAGADKVSAEIEKRPPGWLLEASDGAPDGRNKMIRLAGALYGSVHVAGALCSDELGMAFGRNHVIHALVKRGRFAKLWARDYARLSGFRHRPEEDWLSENVGDVRGPAAPAGQKFKLGG